jgi:hypothetical protein
MRLLELSLLYAMVGAGAAAALLWRRGLPALADALLTLLFWPLYGPFLLAAEAPRALGREAEFLAALKRADGTPLAALLPDQAAARALARRLRVAGAKVAEIDQLLDRPEFSEEAARRRLGEPKARGASDTALEAAQSRAQNIARLRGLRDRFARELDEVGELLAQLTTQAEVVRLAGATDAGATELVRELIARVEGFDAMLDDGPASGDFARLPAEPAPQAAPVKAAKIDG